MGSREGDGDGELTPVTMEDLKNLETRLSSSLVNEVKKMIEQLLKDKEGSSPPSPQEDQPSILPKGNTLVSPELWHPAKTTTRKSRCFCALHHHDRMLISSCHIAF